VVQKSDQSFHKQSDQVYVHFLQTDGQLFFLQQVDDTSRNPAVLGQPQTHDQTLPPLAIRPRLLHVASGNVETADANQVIFLGDILEDEYVSARVYQETVVVFVIDHAHDVLALLLQGLLLSDPLDERILLVVFLVLLSICSGLLVQEVSFAAARSPG